MSVFATNGVANTTDKKKVTLAAANFYAIDLRPFESVAGCHELFVGAYSNSFGHWSCQQKTAHGWWPTVWSNYDRTQCAGPCLERAH